MSSPVVFCARAFVGSYSVNTHGIRRTIVKFLVAFVSVVTIGSVCGETRFTRTRVRPVSVFARCVHGTLPFIVDPESLR